MWTPRVVSGRQVPLPSALPLALMLMVVVMLTLLSPPVSGLQVSARRGQDRRLTGATHVQTLTDVSLQRCQVTCHQLSGCRSFNFHTSSGSCEVFSVTACDSSSFAVEPAAGWSWFDVVPDGLTAEPQQELWSGEACARDGRCRDSCLRRLGQGCRHTEQCAPLVTGATNCSERICHCDQQHWQYNETLCLPRYANFFTDGESWVWKKIVNGMCSTHFLVMSTGNVEIAVFEAYTHYTGRYVLKITATGINVYRYEYGVSSKHIGIVSKTFYMDTKYVRLNFHWCGGRLRISQGVREEALFAWDDPDPLQQAGYLAMRSSGHHEGHWRLGEHLVDPWFGDWSPDRVYSIPRDTMVARRRHEQDFWVEFECRVAQDCNWMAREQKIWHGSNIWKIVIGGWSNTQCRIIRHKPGVGWIHFAETNTPGILSARELRRFRIHFSPQLISVYRADETEPFMKHAPGDPFTINYDGPHMCCNVPNVDFRLAQYDAGWSYEGGFRWGENLID